jgi:hypothetical protein
MKPLKISSLKHFLFLFTSLPFFFSFPFFPLYFDRPNTMHWRPYFRSGSTATSRSKEWKQMSWFGIPKQEWVPHDPIKTNRDPVWSANYNAPLSLSQKWGALSISTLLFSHF